MVHPNRTKDVETKTSMEKPKQANLAKQFSSSGMIFCNASENRQQYGDNKSFVAKIVDTLSDRNVVERGNLIDLQRNNFRELNSIVFNLNLILKFTGN